MKGPKEAVCLALMVRLEAGKGVRLELPDSFLPNIFEAQPSEHTGVQLTLTMTRSCIPEDGL